MLVVLLVAYGLPQYKVDRHAVVSSFFRRRVLSYCNNTYGESERRS